MSTDLHHLATATPESAPLPASAAGGSAVTVSPATADFSEDPGLVMTSCANCGAQMLDRKCKLICSCGYFLSCSDYY